MQIVYDAPPDFVTGERSNEAANPTEECPGEQ
jgi:hypothetical protein